MKPNTGLGCSLAAVLALCSCQLVTGLNDLTIDRTDDEVDSTDDSSTTNTSTDPDSTSGDCAIPSGLACAPTSNCGCESEQVCGLTDEDGDLAVACHAPGKQKQGDDCDLGDCANGLLCIEGVCIPSCRFDNDCEADNAQCEEVQRPNGQALKGIRYCQENCDLVSPADPTNDFQACDGEQSCVVSSNGSRCVNDLGNGTQGESCETDANCDAGLTCESNSCKQWCRVDSPNCSAGLECKPVTGGSDATLGLGLCDGGCPASIPAGDECLTDPNCGCPIGETCRAMVDGARVCSPAGDSGPQTVCEDNSACSSGLACIGALCRPYCDPEATSCADGSTCINVEYEGEPVPGVGACLGLCDPVYPDTDHDVYTPCGDGAECIAGDLEYGSPQSFCAEAPATQGDLTGHCDAETLCGETSTCIEDRCFPFCREDDDCYGFTMSPLCYTDDLGYRGSPDDVLGVCCSPLPVAGSECSAFGLECGCAEGWTCRSEGDDGRAVCSEVGDTGYQEPCEFDTECEFASSCIGGLCRPHCSGECAANEGACVQITSGDDVAIPIPHAFVCTGRCDPVNPERSDTQVTPCGAGAQCIAGWEGSTDAISMASFCAFHYYEEPVGGACTFDSDCALGLGCDFRDCPEDDLTCLGICVEYCASNDDCDEGSTCDLDVGRVGTPGTPIGYCESPSIGPVDDAG